MSYSFYSDPEYRKKQSEITREHWKNGLYNFTIKPLEIRYCKNKDCHKNFKVKPGDPKIFCSHTCSAHISNRGRTLSESTRLKISQSVSLLPHSTYTRKLLPRIPLLCKRCGKEFLVIPYLAKTRKYCGVLCASKALGAMTTSPKASKGKPGIRERY